MGFLFKKGVFHISAREFCDFYKSTFLNYVIHIVILYWCSTRALPYGVWTRFALLS